LMRGLKKAAKPKLPKLRLSVTVHPGDWYEKAFGVASHVHLMSYDACTSVPCRHSTLETAQAHAEQLLTKGLPAKKLVLGLPAYARCVTGSQGRPPCCCRQRSHH
jgi:GH18 family chitinase